MAKYNLSNKAVDDLSKIWFYTFNKWSEKQADRYYQLLLDTFQEIANNTIIGKKYEGIGTLIFGYNAGRHIIFFRRLDENEVEIIRILHEQMDLKNRLTD